MLLKMTEEPDDYEGPWPREDAMTKPTVDDVMALVKGYGDARVRTCGPQSPGDYNRLIATRIRCEAKVRSELESLIAPAAPQQAEPVGHFLFDKEWKTWEQMADKYQNDSDAVPLYRHPPAAQAVCDSYAAENQQLSDEVQRLRDAARAVIERWDSPKWKDESPTADVINALRRALEGKRC